MKKISILVALLITFLLGMAGQTAMAAGIETASYFSQVQKHEMAALVAEPVNFNHERSKSGEKDTVLGVYAVLPIMMTSDRATSISHFGVVGKIVDKNVVVAGYKDRPGWIAL